MNDGELLKLRNRVNNLIKLKNNISYKKDALALSCLIVSWLAFFYSQPRKCSILNIFLISVSVLLPCLAVYYMVSNTIDTIRLLIRWKNINKEE